MKYVNVAHRLPWRTRIKANPLRYVSSTDFLEAQLTSLEGVSSVRINPLAASVIITHENGRPDLKEIRELIRRHLNRPCPEHRVPSSGGPTGKKETPHTTPHVSGTFLITSGMYLFAGWLKIISFPVSVSVILTTALGMALSVPIVREEIKSIRETGRPGLTTLTVSALYYAMASGASGSALSILWLFNLSSWLETRTLEHTRKSIREMLQHRTRNAWLIKDGVEIEVPASSLVRGDTIRLVEGSVIPVDGTLQTGSILVNEAVMTGESMPLLKKKGDTLLAGTIVESGHGDLNVVSPESDTRLAAIIRYVENAENANTGYQRFAEQFGKRLFPFSISLFAGTLLLTGNLCKAVSMLIITCPCAIRLSTSTAITAAMGNAAKKGILVKGGEHIEQAGKINTLVFDKTGTLTNGTPNVSRVVTLDENISAHRLLQIACAVQKPFRHPVTSAVLEKATAEDLEIPPAVSHTLHVGKGVRATVDRLDVRTGSRTYMTEYGIDCRNAVFLEKHMAAADEIILYIAVDGRLTGLIGMKDLLRENASSVLSLLKNEGIGHMVMLTGDRTSVAKKAAANLPLDEVLCELSPEDKAEWITARKKVSPGSVTAMVGDGINDTPAFACADLSFAIGEKGADTAVEYADIVIRKDDLSLVAESLYLGRKTASIFRQNVTATLFLNALLCVFTALELVSPFSGALFHNLVTLGVVGNSGRLITAKGPFEPENQNTGHVRLTPCDDKTAEPEHSRTEANGESAVPFPVKM